LVPGDADFLCVQHDYVVARVHVRRVYGLVLAAEAHRDLGGEAAERLAARIYHVPVAPHALRTRKNCAHTKAPKPGPEPPAGPRRPPTERRLGRAAALGGRRAKEPRILLHGTGHCKARGAELPGPRALPCSLI